MYATRADALAAAWNVACDAALETAWNAAWDAARDVSRDAALDAAWKAARNAAMDTEWDAATYAVICIICADLPIDQHHIAYVRRRWSVREAGYGVLCDVDGVLYCYRRT